ncbi:MULTISPECIES: LysR family transcriptional regulator [Ochrobactrum]|jgi:DNA-binding transcriptional LysR family regulator|uniref:LysR family transcriptional regulator n=1 Tax=Ochrobactrum quorumnocens TaxID=271865 RepID=A0A5N1JZ82_9HYPH|nr:MULTISPECIES: LysR family transcriptional regulator [Brucella/Ochrobactrum group]KAA9367334.1 LysR family transcriptional regulator [[Ochrobactrum] quorumnocens]MDH7793770.1 DNA-binding transcriptional LysR family regulator [Ochrobactrum sp. AN78]
MELKWLEDFIALASTASFSRAAAARHVTQSAFSRRIKQLEVWLDVTLVNRATFPAQLTQEGKAFLVVAEETVRQFYVTRESLQANRQGLSAAVKFSALHTLTVTFFPGWLQELAVETGAIRSQLVPDRGGFEDNIATLSEGEVDFFLTYAHPSVPTFIDKERFPSVVLGAERLIPVSLPVASGPVLDHAIATGTAVAYLSYGEFSFFGAALAKKFAARPGFSRKVVHENTMSIGLKAMMQAGWGMAWLPESLVEEELRRGEIALASTDPYWNLTVEIRILRHQSPLSFRAETIWKHLTMRAAPA